MEILILSVLTEARVLINESVPSERERSAQAVVGDRGE
jgi:hypothetical protein